MVGVGAPATDWANDGLFGDGWHLFGIGSSAYNDAADEYAAASDAISGYYELDTEAEDFDADAALAEMKAVTADSESTTCLLYTSLQASSRAVFSSTPMRMKNSVSVLCRV